MPLFAACVVGAAASIAAKSTVKGVGKDVTVGEMAVGSGAKIAKKEL